MYVDDIIAVSFDRDLQSDLFHSKRVCTDLLGSTAVVDDKTEWGRRVDIIGYVIDLDHDRVSISRKNLLNTLYGSLLVDIDAALSLKTAQGLALWSSRYDMVCRAMRPCISWTNGSSCHVHAVRKSQTDYKALENHAIPGVL